MKPITKDYQLFKNKFEKEDVYPIHQMNLWTCCLYVCQEEMENRRYQSG